MDLTNHVSKAKAAIAKCAATIVVACSTAMLAQAAEQAPPKATAWAIVNEYRELRRHCAAQSGDARKSCFHKLHASNDDYRLAKQRLQLGATDDPENIHLVTF